MPGVLARLDLALERVALRAAGDVDEGRHPVERGEELVHHRARLDVPRPAHDARRAIAALPRLALLPLERRDATVGERDRLGAVVGGEDDDGVVELAHVLQLLEDDADVVVHLLHAGFVDAPVLAAALAEHRLVLRRQHGRRRACARGCTRRRTACRSSWDRCDRGSRRPWPRSPRRRSASARASAGPRPCTSGSLACRRRTCTHRTGRGGVRQVVVFGSTAPGDLGHAGDRRVLARRRDRLHGR